MGFLDNVKDALKDAVTTQASKDAEAAPETKADEVVAEESSTKDAALAAGEAEAARQRDAAAARVAAAEAEREAEAAAAAQATAAAEQAAAAEAAARAEAKAERQEERAEKAEAKAEAKAEREEAREERREAREERREQAKADKLRTYTVKSGDTLSEIGQRFGVAYMDIARLNNIENPDLIFPGQVFKIPNN